MTEKITNNITWHGSQVTQADRKQLLGNRPMTLWFTGLSASGKSTLAFALERALIDAGRACYVLDGDNVRHGLNANLGFSLKDRTENIRRVAEVAKLMNEAGLIVICAFISPTIADREMAKAIIGTASFKEIYVSTSLAICESRDPKGLYVKARAGQIKEFTGISASYETPPQPDLAIDTSQESLSQHVNDLLKLSIP